jgi:hypothetical protein
MKNRIKCLTISGLLLLFISCGNSTDEIAETVKYSLQETLVSDPDFKEYDLKVKSVDVMHQSGNSYKGFAYIDFKGKEHSIKIDILADGDDVMWEAPEGSFYFIEEEEFMNLFE